MRKFFRGIKARVIYFNAVRLADECYRQTGKQHFVIADTDGRLIVCDKKNFRTLKRKHYAPDITTFALLNVCIYHTPNGIGKAAMSELEKEARKERYIQLKCTL